ncbi:hypothetical protein IW150_002779 [Coemansia sp. RSA 2607]|nr:hypothetical protein IW150_002779 [Coemansia sp. RSA 2607]KAJ2384968.1 hypothetical protein GGI05_004841 [Coemansia sp. RSA 2603]
MAIGEAPESLDELLDASKGVTSMTADTYVTFFKSYAPEFDPDLLTMTTTEWVDIINRLIKNGMEELDSYYIMRLAKDKLKGSALEFVQKTHYSNYEQMAKSLLSEFTDHWFKIEVLKIVESG